MIAVELVPLSEVESPGPKYVLAGGFHAELSDGTPVDVTAVLERTVVAIRAGEPAQVVNKRNLMVDPDRLAWKRQGRGKGNVKPQRCETCRKTKGDGVQFAGVESDYCLSCEAKRAAA